MPAFDLMQDGMRYFDIHHTPDDTLDKIDRQQLDQNVAAWAALVWLAADSDGRLPPPPRAAAAAPQMRVALSVSAQILVSSAAGVCEIRFNRPEKRNAITFAMYEALCAALAPGAGRRDGARGAAERGGRRLQRRQRPQ